MSDGFWKILALRGIKGGGDTPTQEKTVALDMANGNQIINPDDGKIMTQATVLKPATMVAGNIKSGVDIGGVVGSLVGKLPEETKTVDLAMANGNQTVNTDSGKTMSAVVIRKPATLLPSNIKKDVDIGGVVGSMESDALDGLVDGSITNFVMPADKTQIVQYRFYGFENLVSADLGNVQDIGNYAFYQCVNLTSITLPETTESIGNNAFDGDSNVTHLSGTFDGNIGDYAFRNLIKVSECDFSDFNIHSLGQYAFSAFGGARTNPSQNLLVVDLSKSDFDKIPQYCFGTSSSTNKIKYMQFTFPNTVKSIEGYAFAYADNCDFYFASSTPPTLSATTVWNNITNSKIFVPYSSANAYRTATNWTTQASNIIGYVGAGVLPVGSELPTLGAEGYALTWFSDKACTISATTVENADTTYYCTIGTEKIGYGVKTVTALSCSVTISDGTKTYREGDGILTGTVVTITTAATESGFVPYLLQVNNEDFTSGDTFTINEDLNITAIYWDGENIPVQPVFGDNSWVMIRLAFRNGLAATLWAVGDQKEVTLGDGNTYHIRIADMQSGRYNLTDGSGTTNGVLEFVECLPTSFVINSSKVTDGDVTAYTAGGWAMCQMKNTTLDVTVWGWLPDDMKDAISEITLNEYSYSSPSPRESTNKLFLPAETEIFMSQHFSGEGSQTGCIKYDRFDYYASATTDNALPLRRKYKLGQTSVISWWLRSPYVNTSSSFCDVTGDGNYDFSIAYGTCGVAPCFAI